MTVRPPRPPPRRDTTFLNGPPRPRGGWPFGMSRVVRNGVRVEAEDGVYLCGETRGPDGSLTLWAEKIR